ncbi:hypothetical protein ACXZ74_06525 [Streptococcus agalactiae]
MKIYDAAFVIGIIKGAKNKYFSYYPDNDKVRGSDGRTLTTFFGLSEEHVARIMALDMKLVEIKKLNRQGVRLQRED